MLIMFCWTSQEFHQTLKIQNGWMDLTNTNISLWLDVVVENSIIKEKLITLTKKQTTNNLEEIFGAVKGIKNIIYMANKKITLNTLHSFTRRFEVQKSGVFFHFVSSSFTGIVQNLYQIKMFTNHFNPLTFLEASIIEIDLCAVR